MNTNGFYTKLKKLIPSPLKFTLRFILRGLSTFRFWIKYGFLPPPKGTDLVGYEVLIDEILRHKLIDLEGDFVEIGAFVGGGTYKLSKTLLKYRSQKRIFVIDIFNISADTTKNTLGKAMSDIYASILKGRDQWEVFCKVTKNLPNIVVLKGDSKKVTIPTEKIAFAFIDGNHEPSYVINDFYLVWPKLSIGGVVAFDDYGYDLPMVTETINCILSKHVQEIEKIWTSGKVIFIKKGITRCLS